MSEPALPIDALRDEVLAAVDEAPLVLAAPTGSGKSTQVPRWLRGRVVVVEPRRVACRSLAQRVAELEGARLGGPVGYRVRDDVRASGETRVLFVTPGVALRDPSALERADAVVLDEFHERRLDVDLLFGLLAARRRGLVVMSATLDGERVAKHLGGRFLEGEGRLHPVDVCYLGRGAQLPTPKDLVPRVSAAVDRAGDDAGDVLVFLPGRAEIAACADALRRRAGLRVLELHGGLSLKDQSRVFAPTDRRKVVLATNVAETSVTIPGIGVVIDAGLVRRTRYHRGRGFLTLSPVALDSAEQRAGRAGR
ncbi:MAG TPA: helicase-related protein, partial [Sandaracinaceae bacterium LLY-WYZ-13_1]|nr:helicase-related protein [Sandaracinaceae bacterium LLY-WYZ-13_1]